MCTVSVVVPAYNASVFIAELIDSVLSQSYPDFELLIVNDGSTDNTVDIINSYSDPRIFLLHNTNKCGGPAAPRNIGLHSAKGKYVFFIDADDVMLPDKIQYSVEALEKNPEANFLFTNFSSIDENGVVLRSNYLESYTCLWKMIGSSGIDNKLYRLSGYLFCEALARTNFIGTSSVVLRKSAIAPFDRFNEELKNADDYLFWIRFLNKNNALFLNRLGHCYRVHSGSISNLSYLRRGASRIKCVQILIQECANSRIKKIFSRKLAGEYTSMAYAYKKKKDRAMQMHYSILSLKLYFTMRAFKLTLSAALFYFIR